MPAPVITPADVKLVVVGTTKGVEDFVAGEAIDAGEWAYLDPATDKVMLADDSSVVKAKVKGMALNSATLDQPIKLNKTNPVNVSATLTAGEHYFVGPSSGPGTMVPAEDLATGDFGTYLGYAETTSKFIPASSFTYASVAHG